MVSSLSAGAMIRAILTQDEQVKAKTEKVFPILIEKAELPYILYRRASLQHSPTKAGSPGADTVQMEVVCYAAQYAESIALAEAVRGALDYAQYEANGLTMRGCYLTDSEEMYEDDAYVQSMIFTIKL